MNWLTLYYNGIMLGLGVAAPMGPINIEIARRTLRHRQASGVAVGLGAVSGDVMWACASGLAVMSVLNHPAVRLTLGGAGGLLLLWLAWLCFKALGRPVPALAAEEKRFGPALLVHYRTGLLMALISPYNLMFWLVAVPGVASQWTAEPRRDLPWVAAGVFTGAFSWVIGFSTAVSMIGRMGRDRWLKAADAAGGVLLLGFGLRLIWHVLRGSL